MSPISDKKLIQLYIQGDNKAFDMLLDKYKSKIFNLILYKVKYDRYLADEVFQETFVKAIIALKNGQYKEEHLFTAWILRIANNIIIDNFKKKKVTAYYDEIDRSLIPFENSIEDQIIKYETKNQIKKAMCKLSPSQKEIVALRMEGTSFKDIALAKNISINTALGRMRYACLSLKKTIN